MTLSYQGMGASNNEPLPIMSNESFTFNHSDKLGVELKFMHTDKRFKRFS